MVYNGDAPSALQRQLLIEMPDAREIPAVLEAAAQAASAGDLASAEALLHEVVSLQEARLSPLHPDLASTYNNLAVVSEMAGKAADAEQFYRRAYTIASRSLKPDDPLVTTSFNNLKDFCASRGLPLDVSAEAPAAAVATPPERIPPSPAPASSAPAAEPATAPGSSHCYRSPEDESGVSTGSPVTQDRVGHAHRRRPRGGGGRRPAGSGLAVAGRARAGNGPGAGDSGCRGRANACCAARCRPEPAGNASSAASSRQRRAVEASRGATVGWQRDEHAGPRGQDLPEPVHRGRRVAMRGAIQTRDSRTPVLLHSRRGTRGRPRAPSLVQR